ncbi:MAG: hypothetical protein WCG06_03785, partial [Candidatus Omnitrophota bacterium]
NVPDMPDPGDGAMTLFWPNDQSSRLMWYHDHTMGLTRQNAYSGQAAGYVVMDAAEIALIAGGTVNGVAISKAIPNGALDQVVLVLQDKTFVPDDIDTQDSKWDTTHWGTKGDLWFPHVYEPNQIWTRTSVAGDTLPAATNPAGPAPATTTSPATYFLNHPGNASDPFDSLPRHQSFSLIRQPFRWR